MHGHVGWYTDAQRKLRLLENASLMSKGEQNKLSMYSQSSEEMKVVCYFH